MANRRSARPPRHGHRTDWRRSLGGGLRPPPRRWWRESPRGSKGSGASPRQTAVLNTASAGSRPVSGHEPASSPDKEVVVDLTPSPCLKRPRTWLAATGLAVQGSPQDGQPCRSVLKVLIADTSAARLHGSTPHDSWSGVATARPAMPPWLWCASAPLGTRRGRGRADVAVVSKSGNEGRGAR